MADGGREERERKERERMRERHLLWLYPPPARAGGGSMRAWERQLAQARADWDSRHK